MTDDIDVEWVEPEAPKTQLEQDIESARGWIVAVGSLYGTAAMRLNKRIDGYLNKVELAAALAQLPGDMPLRIRCFPNVWNLKA